LAADVDDDVAADVAIDDVANDDKLTDGSWGGDDDVTTTFDNGPNSKMGQK
jgi:hypothetical protein